MRGTAPNTVDEYISTFRPEVQALLTQMRDTVKLAAPVAIEKISYGMPAYTTERMLVYYAAFKNHIGFFPGVAGVEKFRNRLDGYYLSKGTIRFPFGKPLPLELVAEITRFRLEENSLKALARKKKK